MDAFESLIAMLLRHEGYWVAPSFKVELSKEEKRLVGRHSTPRWELDLVAYKGATNEILAIECKSFLDSTGVVFRSGAFEPPKRYKLFGDEILRRVVLECATRQLSASGACAASPKITLCLAAGKIAKKSDRAGLERHFADLGWRLLSPEWVKSRLLAASKRGYENDVAFVVSKLLLRGVQNANNQLPEEPELTRGPSTAVEDVVRSIPSGSLRSYSWVAERLGYAKGGARAAGERIADATKRLWASSPQNVFPEDFPWWRVVGKQGRLHTYFGGDEKECPRQVRKLELEGHVIRRRKNSAPRVELRGDFE